MDFITAAKCQGARMQANDGADLIRNQWSKRADAQMTRLDAAPLRGQFWSVKQGNMSIGALWLTLLKRIVGDAMFCDRRSTATDTRLFVADNMCQN